MSIKHFKKTVLDYLIKEPLFRERSNKDRGIANLLIKRYGEPTTWNKETLIAALQDYASMDRCWRKITEVSPELRGSDYESKEALERKAQKELGYNVQ